MKTYWLRVVLGSSKQNAILHMKHILKIVLHQKQICQSSKNKQYTNNIKGSQENNEHTDKDRQANR